MTLDELKATLDSFSPVQIEFVAACTVHAEWDRV